MGATVRNREIREPEMRLLALTVVGAVAVSVGYQRGWP
jgi:hypothetical protein